MPKAGESVGFHFREVFTAPGGGETVRAFVIFGALLLVLAGIAGQLAFREVSLTVLSNRMSQIRREAQAIADAGVSADLAKVEKIDEIAGYGVAFTPALVIDDEVKCSGKLPKPDRIAEWLRAADGVAT